jgi:hypothetical protein
MTRDRYDTHPLRYHAAKRLALNDVPDALWNKAVTRRYVLLWDDAPSTADRSEIQERLVDSVREDIRAVANLGGDITPWTAPKQKGGSSVEGDLSPEEPIALRAAALCVYWAKLAEADRNVRSFRTNVLGGATISSDEAGRFMTSTATALLRPETFARRGIPIVGHTANLDVTERSNPFESPHKIHGSLRLKWSTGEAVVQVKKEGPRPPEPMEVWTGSEPILVAPWPLSVLGQLRKAASKLAERYPWEMPAAAWFVLTDEPPWVPPLTATSSGPDLAKNHGTITVRAAHWVPEEAVRQLYLRMKGRMKPTPTTSPRRLALFRFVTERSSGINELDKGELVTGLVMPPWRGLQSEWNEQYPPSHKWHYRDVRNFRRDFTEASKLLVGY